MKSNVKTKILFSVILLLFSFICSAVPIIENGKSDWTIYVPADAIPANKTAAAELQSFLQKATGVKLEITQTAKGENQILIGQSAAAEKLLPALKGIKWKSDEIMIAPAGNNLILTGEQPRGPLYATYEFLEQIGVRFWSATEIKIPSLKTVKLPGKSYRYAPQIPVRVLGIYESKAFPMHGARMRLHNPVGKQDETWGGSIQLIGPWHTFDSVFMPAAKYLKTNPEFFSLRGKKRVGGQMEGQLCLSNMEMRKEFLKNVLAELKKHENPKFISITQNDNDNNCQCANCLAMDKKFGGVSGTMLDFANYIAENLVKVYPDIIVQTFAYRYTQTAPTNIKGHKNVSVFYCTLNRDMTRPLQDTTRPLNAKIAKDLTAWSKIVKQIDIWDYATSFASYFSPMPNMRVVPEDIKFLRDRNVHMLQIQGNTTGNGNPEELQSLRYYLWAKALWNPDLDVDKIIKEYVEDYYGKAAPAIMEYIAFRDKINQKIDHQVPVFIHNAPWISDEDIMESLKYIEKAKRLADTDVIRGRVEKLRKNMEYMKIVRWERMLKKKLITNAELRKLSADWIDYFNKRNYFTLSESWVKVNIPDEIVFDKMRLFSKGIGFERKPNQFLKSLAGKKYVIIEEVDFQVSSGHKWAKLIEDPKAVNGAAIEIPLTGAWAVTFHESHYLLPADKNYHLYIAVKLTKPSQGKILEICQWRSHVIFQKNIDASRVKPEYTYIYVGKVNTSSQFTTIAGRGYTFIVPEKKTNGGKLIVDHVVYVETK